jgi:hypothetical protein
MENKFNAEHNFQRFCLIYDRVLHLQMKLRSSRGRLGGFLGFGWVFWLFASFGVRCLTL